MNGLPYYKAYPRDFFEGTIGMAFETKGAYRLVVDLIYMQNGRLPDDPRYISGLLGCSIRKWNSIKNELVRLGKLHVSGKFLTNYRAVAELETLSKHQDKQRENRSRPNKNNDLKSPRSDHLRDYPEPEPEKKETPKGVPKKNEPTPLEVLEEYFTPALAKEILRYRRQDIRKPVKTAVGAKKLANQISQHPNPEEALQIMKDNEWQGFNVEWLDNRTTKARGGHGPPYADTDKSLIAVEWRFQEARKKKEMESGRHSGPTIDGYVEDLPAIGCH